MVPRAIARLVVASKNPDKIAEIEAVLARTGVVGEIVRDLQWQDVEETGGTLEANALLKARAVALATGLPALADDTGLEVSALDGAPGVITGRYAGPGASYADNVARLLADMEGIEQRSAVFRSVVAIAWPEGRHVLAEGTLRGVIAESPRGVHGFGYDPVFEVDGRTLGEMEVGEKNRISHRARALRRLAEAMAS